MLNDSSCSGLIPGECHIVDPNDFDINPIHVFLHKSRQQFSCSETEKFEFFLGPSKMVKSHLCSSRAALGKASLLFSPRQTFFKPDLLIGVVNVCNTFYHDNYHNYDCFQQ